MNWDAALRRAALEFNLPPDRFWRLSLKEWRALAGDVAGVPPLSRTDFEALTTAHPDLCPHPPTCFASGSLPLPQAGEGPNKAASEPEPLSPRGEG
jgi:uncharacterized phage protein (TIGR02216 family)